MVRSKEFARLAWLRHAASVSPEPGSNPSFESYRSQVTQEHTTYLSKNRKDGCEDIIPGKSVFVKMSKFVNKMLLFHYNERQFGLRVCIPWLSLYMWEPRRDPANPEPFPAGYPLRRIHIAGRIPWPWYSSVRCSPQAHNSPVPCFSVRRPG